MRLKNVTKYAALAGALAAPVAFMAPASAATGGGSSAFGVSATGLVNIPPTPAVSSAAQPHDKSVLSLPANPLVDLKVLHVTAKQGHARASVTDLEIAKAALSAHLVKATCKGGTGSSELVKLRLAGKKVDVGAAPNSTIAAQVPGLGPVTLVLNKQVPNADGGITVTALELSLPLPPGKTQTISISSVTCGGKVGGPGEPSTPPTSSPDNPTPPGEAPAPTPVDNDLPVTG